MRPVRNTINAFVTLILCLPFVIGISLPANGQLGFAFDIKKPQEYEERVLRSEKSDQGKFGLPKRFIQNTATHFNYYFNANNKLNEVLERAKEVFKDDYSKLLPFYNFSLDVTAGDSIQLDSITYKASSGIALHDLRGDWVDNLYLLWGASFYLQKKFDSAYLMFQFINYAFAPKEKDGYYLTIGSGRDGNSALSIATKEKRSLPKKLLSEPPSRNDAFIWQIRNFLAQDQFAEAASLIVTLRDDPVFPKRLQNDLHEVQAYWFYKQNMWDSAAVHLTKALSNATNLQEKARWEYLAAQLFEMSGNHKEAEKYYGKVIGHTTDLVLEIYARLATIRADKDGGAKSIEKNAEELVKMARRDKYQEYRDIIYYMAAQMMLEANKTDEAMTLLRKSTQYSGNDPSQRNKAFLQLAELSFARKEYRNAYNFYDSVNIADPRIQDPQAITARKKSLELIVANIEIIYRQDSLQRIAAMPEDARREYVKQLVKQLRKQQGLKDDNATAAPSPFATPNDNLFPVNLPKGEWYFYNAASKTRGLSEFKDRWGTRANVDNWRRSAVIIGKTANPINQPGGNVPAGNTPGAAPTELTFDALYDNLPLTETALKKSNDSLQNALFSLGKAYIQEIEECRLGIETLEQLRTRFAEFQPMDEVLFNLYYCYQKNGETAKAEAIKKLMKEKHSYSNLTTIVSTGKNPVLTQKEVATREYEDIYDLFIEGKFEDALARKKTADEKFGRHFWTPQLLYIEAVYYIRQRQDDKATRVLNDIVTQFQNTPLAEKAQNLINVLARRNEIEEELRIMVVTRATDSTAGKTVVPVTPPPVVTQPKKDTTNASQPAPVVVTPPKPVQDTVAKAPPPKVAGFSYSPGEPHYVVLVLNKVDPVFVNEAKNAFARHNRDLYPGKNYSADLYQLDDENRLLMIAPFANAQDAVMYVDANKARTSTQIIPWLKGGKYSYMILTNQNFNLLKESKDIEGYRNFLNQYWPGKFQ
ncbi:MAG: tetratricopeptide repeat protein [Chitinophagaceae bacterium]